MHTISSSRETIKALLAGLTEGVLALLLVSLISCDTYSEQKLIPEIEVSRNQLVLQPEKGKWFFEGKPFSGFAISYYANGSLVEKTGFYDGKKEGIAQKWYPNQVLRYEAFYKKNRKDGIARGWSQEGVLVQESNYVEGIAHGTQKYWYDSGKPFKETNFNMGREEGIQKGWLENGGIFANYEAKNGRFFGLKRANACYEVKEEIIQF